MTYEEFWWYIHPDTNEEGYYHRIDRAPGGHVPDDRPLHRLPSFLQAWANIRYDLEDPQAEVDPAELEAFGQELLECLTEDDTDVRDVYRHATISLKDHPLRLTLELVGPELTNFPWEYLYDPALARHLALTSNLSLVRGLKGDRLRRAPDPLNVPLCMLVVTASPAGTDPINPQREQALLEEALRPSLNAGLVEVEWLHGASRQELSARLAAQEMGDEAPLHIVHFVCHGQPGYAEGEGRILLEGDEGEREPVEARELASWLGALDSLRLVVLSACLTARTNDVSEFSGVAQALVRKGLPAVIAMQHEIPLNVAEDFARAFYGTLFGEFLARREAGAFERAFATARQEVSDKHTRANPSWGTPVLYVRARMGDPFPLVAMPEGLTDEQRQEMDALTKRLAFLRESLTSLHDTYGDPLRPSSPGWVREEMEELRSKVTDTEARLDELRAGA